MLERVAKVALELLILGFAAYFLVWVLTTITIVVVAFVIGTLFCALLRPFALVLRRRGVGPAAATWITILLFWGLLAALFFGVGQRAAADAPKLVDDTAATVKDLQNALINGPLHVPANRVNDISKPVTDYLNHHRSALTSGVLTGALVVTEVVTGAILAFFIGFFLMYDGERIFRWAIGFAPARHRPRLRAAGSGAWAALSGYVRGTLIVALFHGVVIGVTLTIMRVPLALPLAVLVAFGSFIPLVGAVVFGGLAVLVTLVTHGWVLAVVLVGVLVAENQAEAHLLQPFVVGRYVHLHPLAIALVLATGTIFGGLWGALFAVPFTAAGWAAYKAVTDTPAVAQPEPRGSPGPSG
jgi:predicted PurR-regulated permease PerM